jgi:uncharacterized protein (UPF0276 family)
VRHPPVSKPRRPIPRLGIGLEYQEALQPFIAAESDTLDFLEVIPDLLWLDRGPDASPRHVDDVNGMAFVSEVANRMPIVCHSIGLSIGSADRFDTEHVTRIADWVRDFRSPWHSDHLAFQRVELEGADINAGVTLPLALDRQALDLLVPRVRAVLATIPVPFLLENNVYFFELPESEMEEPEFLNELCDRAGCGLLVDVHNLYVNSRNHRIDPYRWLSRLNLEHVVEIHLAGGMELEGFYVDAHSGAVPEPVWELLEVLLAGAANIAGIVFEMVGSWYEDLGRDGLLAELGRMREAWQRYGAGLAVAR